jgi:fibronectin type 3 domain-containing protein
MNKQILTAKLFTLCLSWLSFNMISYAQEIDMVRPAPEGLIIFAGMSIPNGKIVDHYLIERTEDKKQWSRVAELKSPATWDEFKTRVNQFKQLFPFQELPKNEKIQKLWQKAIQYGTIDSMRPWSGSTIFRLAAANAYYDKEASKKKEFRYRVTAFDSKGKSLSVDRSLPSAWPVVPYFDTITLTDRNVDKKLFYLKWKSTGSNPAPYFKIQYYENLELKTAKGVTAKYNINKDMYYIFQDSIKIDFSERQYFLAPLDVYGNIGRATEITLVSAQSTKNVFFKKTKALAIRNRLGIKLSWRISDARPVKLIKIFRSVSFDKDYEMISTAVATDTTFSDENVVPDKIYYYYLQAESKYNEPPVVSGKFFNFGQDPLKPIAPFISKTRDIKNGVELTIEAGEVNMAGIRIYRSTGKQKDFKPITDIISLKGAELVYKDTSGSVAPDQGYAYAAKIENNSYQLSEFSNIVYVSSGKYTIPPVPTLLSAYEGNHCVQLSWNNMAQDDMAVKGYVIYRRENAKFRFEPISPGDSICLTNEYTDQKVKPGILYEYAIQTVGYGGNVSKTLAIISIHTKDNIPSPPAGIKGFVSEGKAVLQWGEIKTNESLKFKVYRYQRGKKPVELKTLTAKDLTYIDDAVKKGQLYFYYITTVNQDNKESSPSREVSLEL